MWDKPNIVLDLPVTPPTSISPIASQTPVTITDITNTIDSFWKTMHPSYQKLYESGYKFSKVDDESHAAIVKSTIESFTLFYKNQVIQSNMTADQREDELKKIKLLENVSEQIFEILKLLKINIDKNALFAYMVGYNSHLYNTNKGN